jgi:hypothetical protein
MTRLARTRAWAGLVRLLVVVLAGLLLGIGAFWVVSAATQPRRTTPVFDSPVLAGQQLWGACAGGFYARHGDTIVLTSTGHCTSEGTVAYEPDGTTMRGVFGPPPGIRRARILGTRAPPLISTTWWSPRTASRGGT